MNYLESLISRAKQEVAYESPIREKQNDDDILDKINVLRHYEKTRDTSTNELSLGALLEFESVGETSFYKLNKNSEEENTQFILQCFDMWESHPEKRISIETQFSNNLGGTSFSDYVRNAGQQVAWQDTLHDKGILGFPINKHKPYF